MAGVVLATGIVEVIPSMRGSEKAVTDDLARIDTAPVGTQLGQKMGGGMAGALRKVVAPALALLGAKEIGDFSKSAVSSFSELEDSTAAAGVVFGKSMGTIIKQSQGASKQLGLSSQQVINAANTYGTYGKAAGLSGDKLAAFSADFTTLAGDLASFKGTTVDQSIEAIGAALRGETEPMRAYGVMLDDASMRQKALELGIVKTTKDALTPQQKILAAQALIWEQTKDAQGDFARTSQSTANIQKTLAAETENLSAKFGKVLAPAFTAARVRALGTVTSVSLLLDKVLAFQDGLANDAMTPDLVRALGMDPTQGFGYAVGEGIGGLRAFSAAWAANDGEVTSSGFPGFMEKAAFALRTFGGDVRGVYDILAKGDFTGTLFGQEEDSALVDRLFKMREGVQNFYAGLTMDPATKDSIGAPLEGMVDLGYRVGQVFSGDMSQVRPVFEAFLAIAKPAGPILVEVGKGMGELSGSIGGLIAGALPLAIPLLQGAANVMQFLAQHTGILTAVIVTLAAGFVAMKAAQAASHFAAVAAVPVALAQAGANFSLAAALRAQTAAQGQATTAGQIQLGVQRSNTIGTAAATAATGAHAVASGIAAGATKLFGFALKALPFVGIAAAVAGLVGGIIWFFTQTEMGKDIVAAAWAGIQAVVGGVVDWFTNTLLPAGQAVFAGIGAAATWLYENAIRPAFEGVQTALGVVGGFFVGLYNTVKPVFDSIGVIIGGFYLFFRGVGQIIVSLLVNVLAPAFVNLWNGVIAPVFDGIGKAIGGWWDFAVGVFNGAVGFVRDVLGGVFTWFRDSVISPVIGFISERIATAVSNWTWIFGLVVGFFRDTLGPVFTWFRDSVVKPVMDGIGGAIKWVWDNTISPVFNFLKDAIEKNVPAAFKVGSEAIDRIWKGIQDIAKAPIRFVINTVLNDGLIGGFNTIAGILPGVDKLPRIALPAGFRDGGYTGNKPVGAVAGVVHGQEYVVPADSTLKLQRDFPGALEYIRQHGRLPGTDGPVRGYRSGGWVWPVDGRYPVTQNPSGGHPAYDIGTPTGTPVAAAQAGRVVHAGPGMQAPGVFGGNEVHIDHGGVQSWYAHLNAFAAHVGDIVRQGQLIASSGNTGISSGPHLHFGALAGGRLVSPESYLAGGPGSGVGASFNPIAGIIDGLVSQFRERFPAGGFFMDAVIGIGRKLLDSVSGWINKSLGMGNVAGPTVYDGGGWLHNTGGAQLVQHNKAKPDAVLSNQQWSDISKLAADRTEGGKGGDRIVHVHPRAEHDEEMIGDATARQFEKVSMK